jgi:hypothetical protein
VVAARRIFLTPDNSDGKGRSMGLLDEAKDLLAQNALHDEGEQ